MTDSKTATERLREMLDARGVEWKNVGGTTSADGMTEWLVDGMTCQAGNRVTFGIEHLALVIPVLTPEQAIAATLGRPKAKSHPYGYEPDTGAYDTTRCECGCINDISATYCNDCGGEIEIDMNAEKEIYHTPAHMVFVEKHDDGSLEFAGKRYIATMLGCDRDKVYDAGFTNGVKATLQQLDGLLMQTDSAVEIQAWVDRQWEEDVL